MQEIQRLPFSRISRNQIYKALEDELRKKKYFVSANIFANLVKQEQALIETDIKLKKHVRDDHCLLMNIFENIISAEEEYKKDDVNKELILRILIQTIHTIHAQDDSYIWLVEELYRIILKMSDLWDEECKETLSRTRYEYGVVLAEKDDESLEEAISQLSKSLEICRGFMWYTNEIDRSILHEDVCQNLCDARLRLAKKVHKKHPRLAAELAQAAASNISEVHTFESVDLYCNAKLRQTEYLIAIDDFKEALRVLDIVCNKLRTNDYLQRHKSELYYLQGICYFNLYPDKTFLALSKFKHSLKISKEQNFADLEAKTHLCFGKVYFQNNEFQNARNFLSVAKNDFHKLKDFENEKLAKFLLAKIRTYQILPNLINLIEMSSKNFCNFFDILQWKQKLLPFWNESGELKYQRNEIDCLLSEDISETLFQQEYFIGNLLKS